MFSNIIVETIVKIIKTKKAPNLVFAVVVVKVDGLGHEGCADGGFLILEELSLRKPHH